MKRRHDPYAFQFLPLASRASYRLPGFEKTLKSGRTKSHDYVRLDESDLAKKELFAGRDFVPFRRAVAGGPAFYDVCNIDLISTQTDRFNDFVEELPGPANKRAPSHIFFSARTLSNKHQPRA